MKNFIRSLVEKIKSKHKYKIVEHRWIAKEVNGKVEITAEASRDTGITGNSLARLMSKMYRLVANPPNENYSYHYEIKTNEKNSSNN